MPRFLAAWSGSLDVSMVPKGVSTLTSSPFWVMWECLAMRRPITVSTAMQRTPKRMIEPITMRTVLRPLLPPVLGGGAGIPAVVPGTVASATGLPHLLQKRVPSARVAPQELQNAIRHLERGIFWARRVSIPQIGRAEVIGRVRCVVLDDARPGRPRDSRRDAGATIQNRALAPEASAVVGHGEGQEDEEEEYRGDYYQLQELFACAFQVHEEERDQQRFRGGDNEGDGGVEDSEIDLGDLVGEKCAYEQGDPYAEIAFQGR